MIADSDFGDMAFEEVKQRLRKEADRVNATKWQRREITVLALDLLRIWNEQALKQ